MKILFIALFGLLGVFGRYSVGLIVSRMFSIGFPLGTFLINISGAFVIGVVYVLAVEKAAISEDLRLGIMIGFLGGFTTFSSYCLEAARLIEESQYFYAALYFGLSPILGLLSTVGGLVLTRYLVGGTVA